MISADQFRKKINTFIKSKNKKAGLKEINTVKKSIQTNNISHDHIINYLGTMSVFYNSFGLIKYEIETLLMLADVYSTYGAYQSAYRTLAEAEEIARQHNDYHSLAEINSISAAIYFLEGDYEFALKIGEQAIKIYSYLKLKLPLTLTINIATIYMNIERIPEAIELYESIFDTDNVDLLFSLNLNLSICYRKNHDIARSIQHIENVQSIYDQITYDPERFTEFELVSAKTYLENDQFELTLQCLNRAVNHLDTILMQTNKLHYRRGIRERYIIRIEDMLLNIPVGAITLPLLNILSFIRGNLTSDWLHILEWSDEIYSNDKISNEEKEELEVILNKLTNFGAPFLFGFREKYDDHYNGKVPWESSWGLLNDFILEINRKYKIATPYEAANIGKIKKLFKTRLEHQNCIIVSFLFKYGKLLILHNKTYEIVTFEKEKIFNFYILISKYRNMELSSQEFAMEVSKLETILFNALLNIFNDIDEHNTHSLMYIPDRLDFVPLLTTVLKHKNLKEKMLNEAFLIKTTPIVFPQKKISIKKNKILGVIDNVEELYLSKIEVSNFSKIMGIDNIAYISSSESNKCTHEMKDTNILHVTTHGFPITNFADPHHADLNGNQAKTHCINTNEIQENFYKFKYDLVILNSCHSSSSIARSQQSVQYGSTEYATNDIFNFPIILLMNRKSIVISSIWRTFDKFALIFSYNLGKNLAKNDDVEKSFSKTLATIYDLEHTTISDNIEGLDIESKEFIETSKNTISKMVKHPYCYATYQLYSLF